MPQTDIMHITAGLFVAFADEKITVTGTAKSLTAATYTNSDSEGATRAVITCENAQCRYRYAGSNPTATTGHLLNPGQALVIVGSSNIRNFRIIKKGANNGEIFATYEA